MNAKEDGTRLYSQTRRKLVALFNLREINSIAEQENRAGGKHLEAISLFSAALE